MRKLPVLLAFVLFALQGCGGWKMDGDMDFGFGDDDWGMGGFSLGNLEFGIIDADDLVEVVEKIVDGHPPIHLNSVSPDRGKAGDLITLKGDRFSLSDVIVRFPGADTVPVSVFDNTLVVRVPANARSGRISVISDYDVSEERYFEMYPRPIDLCDANACPAGTFADAGGCAYAGPGTVAIEVQVLDHVFTTAASETTVHVVDPITYVSTGVCAVSGADGKVALGIEPERAWNVVATRFANAVDTYSKLNTATTSATAPLLPLWAWRAYFTNTGSVMDVGTGIIVGKITNSTGLAPVAYENLSVHPWVTYDHEAFYFPAGATLPVGQPVQDYLSTSNGAFALLNIEPRQTGIGIKVWRSHYDSVSIHHPPIVTLPYAATVVQAKCPACP